MLRAVQPHVSGRLEVAKPLAVEPLGDTGCTGSFATTGTTGQQPPGTAVLTRKESPIFAVVGPVKDRYNRLTQDGRTALANTLGTAVQP